MNFAIAVKGFIVRDGKVLVLKRSLDAPHKPGAWDIPGGRLDPGEDVFAGLAREVREEAGLVVDRKNPLSVHSFTRDDGQRITMLVFLCRSDAGEVTVSHEHTAFEWVAPEELAARASAFAQDVEAYVRHFRA